MTALRQQFVIHITFKHPTQCNETQTQQQHANDLVTCASPK